MVAVETGDDAWVFPSERMTPLSKDNWWRRTMQPALKKVGLEWANFLVMRRTHATLMKALGMDGKLDDRSLDIYTIETFSCKNGLCHSRRNVNRWFLASARSRS
jgi:integrase